MEPLGEVLSLRVGVGVFLAKIPVQGEVVPESRHQFVAKCAALLREGVSVIFVDVVTVRQFNLYAELLELIGQRDPAVGDPVTATYSVACRWRPRNGNRWLEAWNHTLCPGQPLPCLPLWLTEDHAIPLDLEASYEKTCSDLRIA